MSGVIFPGDFLEEECPDKMTKGNSPGWEMSGIPMQIQVVPHAY